MNAADRRRLTPVLGIVVAVLLVLLIALWAGLGRGVHWHDDAAPSRLPSVGTPTPAPAVPPLDQFADVWQHPLFSPTRTPESAAAEGDGASGDLELTGVIMLPHLRMAIVHDRTNGRDYRIVEGRPSRDGPTLVELHPRSAVVEVSGARQQLRLVPGPASEADGGSGPEAMPVTAGDGASAMVSRHGMQDSGGQPGNRPSKPGAGPDTPEARARALKARIEAQRRRAAHQDGGG
jgi:general secretion pathway protein N